MINHSNNNNNLGFVIIFIDRIMGLTTHSYLFNILNNNPISNFKTI